MARPPQISDAEWEVMNVLWARSPLTGAEVAEELAGRMKWQTKTVKTLLGRLVKKGAVRFREEANRYLYSPAFPRQRYVAAESRSFIQRVFGGKATPALVHMVETLDLSDDDLKELRAILERREREEKK